MQKVRFRIFLMAVVLIFSALLPGTASAFLQFGVKWDENYSFDKCNVFKIEFYAKNNELMRTVNYKTYYQSNGNNFVTKMIAEGRGKGMETVLDKKNEVAIQIFGTGGGAIPQYNAGRYAYPTEAELKKLDITQTAETKQIAGLNCKKYTYTFKQIFGEVWITDQISLSNDLGVFRAAKMAAKHNTLSASGFVMEMTTEDSGGGKTLMTTVSLDNSENYLLDLRGVKMSTAINKVNYYIF
jgi:hypothetical protein